MTGDKADNIIGLNKIGPKRALQIIRGETLLTEEQDRQVSENMKLIDLNNVGSSEWDEEYVTYERQSLNAAPIDFDGFLKICEERRFKTIINQQTIWHKAFCIKSVMANIMSELFSN
jgi:5'-3' exonuclease